MTRRDPVESQSDGSHDLYDVATWERRTRLDWLASKTYGALHMTTRVAVVLLALLILIAQFAIGGLGVVFTSPTIGALTLLSVVPAFLLAAYVYVADVTSSEPLELLVGTFVLGVLFAGFAGIANSTVGPTLQSLGVVGFVLFFYVVVAPVEETVKWLAVRLYAYRKSEFNAVVDGAVYGATAGLGFATIENLLYITQNIEGSTSALAGTPDLVALLAGGVGLAALQNIIGMGGEITAFRALAGPGHVIYSAFAGYYLGLAKFNRENAGPIVVKGLLIAALIHATYNTLVGIVPAVAIAFVPRLSELAAFFGFVLVYDGIFGYVLYRKLARYRRLYRQVNGDRDPDSLAAEQTEFDA